MRRHAAVLSAALCLSLAPARAETDWSKYESFANTRCEDQATIADIRESLKGLKFNEGGGSTFATAQSVRIVRSKTVRATKTTLVCLLTMRTLEAGEPLAYTARHTVTLEPGGQWRTLYQPNY